MKWFGSVARLQPKSSPLSAASREKTNSCSADGLRWHDTWMYRSAPLRVTCVCRPYSRRSEMSGEPEAGVVERTVGEFEDCAARVNAAAMNASEIKMRGIIDVRLIVARSTRSRRLFLT